MSARVALTDAESPSGTGRSRRRRATRRRLTELWGSHRLEGDVAARQQAFAGLPIEWQIEAIEPPTRFAFRWHPYAIERGVDYAHEPTTLVELELAEAPTGTQLTIRESGFDKIPLERRAKAFTTNDDGWAKQAELVASYLSREPAR